MNPRVDVAKVVMPKALRALRPTSNSVNGSQLNHRLLKLVKMRTSQLNSCASCINMRGKDAARHPRNGAAPLPARRLA